MADGAWGLNDGSLPIHTIILREGPAWIAGSARKEESTLERPLNTELSDPGPEGQTYLPRRQTDIRSKCDPIIDGDNGFLRCYRHPMCVNCFG
jgi:hypothetical protein